MIRLVIARVLSNVPASLDGTRTSWETPAHRVNCSLPFETIVERFSNLYGREVRGFRFLPAESLPDAPEL